MKRLMIPVIAAAGCLAWAPVQAKDYVLVTEGEAEAEFLDMESITSVNATTKSGLEISIVNDRAIEDGIKRDDVLMYVDCTGKQFTLKTLKSYDRDGKLLGELTLDDDELDYVPAQADTVGERLVGLVCGTVTPGEDEIYSAEGPEDLQALYDAVMAEPQ